jgi:uncharacterized protein with HEPN domain
VRQDRQFLDDILGAIRVIEQYTPRDRGAFDSDPPVQSHLLRHIQLIGEAAARLSQAVKAKHPEIPWRQIAGMRNAIVHAYFRIDWNEVWNTATRDIPTLRPLIETILNSLPPDEE